MEKNLFREMIVDCGLKKGVETCGDCTEMEACQIIKAIVDHNSEALKNLKG